MNQDIPKETENVGKPADLIYGIDACPPFKEALFAALQHLLAIFVAIITPPLIIAGALKLDLETTGFLVSMSLFASGISTFVQCLPCPCLLRAYRPSFSVVASGRWGRGCFAYREPVFPLSGRLLLLERWAVCH